MPSPALNPEETTAVTAIPGKARIPSHFWMYGTWAVLATGMMLYSQTRAFTDDEGFHLLAALLIKTGMRPYLDFCFPQTPFNAYWNAFWMGVFGESWRTAHVLAALETLAAVVLGAQFVYAHLPERPWRVGGAIAAAMMIGLSVNLVEFGLLGQAYGMCLLTTVGAFRLAVATVERRTCWLAGAAGALAGIAAASSLLAATVAPVLMIWVAWCNRAGSRWTKAAACVAGAALPFLPLLRLYLEAPSVVWFNVAQYHLYYRVVYWSEPLSHDLETLTGWTLDPQSLLMGLLALFGVVYIARRSDWSPERRAEFYLCGWLALGITAELAFAHPTFPRYFCLLTPFVGILAVPGLYALGSRVLSPERPFWPVLIISVMSAAVLARALYEDRNLSTWPEYENIVQKLLVVAPPGKPIFTEEGFYFVMKRRPPPGMEFGYSHKLDLPPARLAALHITPESQLKSQLAAGVFASAASCDNDFVATYSLEKTFTHKDDLHNCSIFWDWNPHAAESERPSP